MTNRDIKADRLARIAEAINQDDPTPHLRETATQMVFGAGSPDAEVVFVGEAPGAKEDKIGEPFVGAAGRFLSEMLSGIGMKREDVYITNIVKYRPPENRDPTQAEIDAFVPYLLRQIDAIEPKLVAFLGRHSMHVFLPDLKISEAHGRPVKLDDRVYLPLFHPAAALYNPGMRTVLMEDFAKIPAILDALDP